MKKNGNVIYVLALVVFAAATLTFRPGVWLVNKPASTQNAPYVAGWQNGCTSGANSYSLLYAPLLDRPFIKDVEVAARDEKDAKGVAVPSKANDYYKSGWNEGFTLCRFYQSAVYELMQFVILIATLLFIGYLLNRRGRAD